MKVNLGILGCSFAAAAAALAFGAPLVAHAQSGARTGMYVRPLVTGPVDDKNLVERTGNVPPAVFSSTDLGKMADDQQLDHLRLQLKRSPEQEAALQTRLNQLQDPKSSFYHQWGTAEQFMLEFGLAEADILKIENWLTSRGLTVNSLTPNMTIDFSGSAKAVSQAFHTEIHNLNANGQPHFSNTTNPKIPAALAAAVLGPVALHDFKPHKLTSKIKPPVAQYTVNSSYQLVVPGDLATIYNYNPLFNAGLSGQGQTVVVLERTDLYNNGDYNAFRKVFGLTKNFPKGKLVVVHPQPSGSGSTVNGVPIAPETCSDPGVVTGDDGEAAVDVEWASASAPSATVELASCADTDTNFGAFIALENLVSASAAPPSTMSLSYGSPESENGTDGNAYINALYQLAVFRGVSLFVSTGDADADVTDQDQRYATHGINVNALASTPNDVAVGGTDYGDSFLGENSVYWSPTNNASFASALSYVPEIPWNDSCASQLITIALGYPTSYGTNGSCNSATGEAHYLTTGGGSGGPSACAYGSPTISGVVGGTCTGYTKPAFQTLVYGNPSDGVRDLPDVSMFAANGVWGHYFVLCYSNPAGGGVPCPTGNPSAWSGAGGTSFGAPIWAGIQALINQATNSAQGNPDFFLYLLAGTQYGAAGSAPCNSTLGNGSAANCIFHDVTLGDNDANCRKLAGVPYNCFYPAVSPGTNGVVSTSNASYQPAYVTTVGYDYATGIGTPNVYNLVLNFPGATVP